MNWNSVGISREHENSAAAHIASAMSTGVPPSGTAVSKSRPNDWSSSDPLPHASSPPSSWFTRAPPLRSPLKPQGRRAMKRRAAPEDIPDTSSGHGPRANDIRRSAESAAQLLHARWELQVQQKDGSYAKTTGSDVRDKRRRPISSGSAETFFSTHSSPHRLGSNSRRNSRLSVDSQDGPGSLRSSCSFHSGRQSYHSNLSTFDPATAANYNLPAAAGRSRPLATSLPDGPDEIRRSWSASDASSPTYSSASLAHHNPPRSKVVNWPDLSSLNILDKGHCHLNHASELARNLTQPLRGPLKPLAQLWLAAGLSVCVVWLSMFGVMWLSILMICSYMLTMYDDAAFRSKTITSAAAKVRSKAPLFNPLHGLAWIALVPMRMVSQLATRIKRHVRRHDSFDQPADDVGGPDEQNAFPTPPGSRPPLLNLLGSLGLALTFATGAGMVRLFVSYRNRANENTDTVDTSDTYSFDPDSAYVWDDPLESDVQGSASYQKPCAS